MVEEQGARTPGKRSLAMAAYARALRAIPTTICDNAGALDCLWALASPLKGAVLVAL